MCTAFDYGAEKVPAQDGQNISAGVTGPLTPFPTPPPPCESFAKDEGQCPIGRCFWIIPSNPKNHHHK
jgi:hypothetical protein